MLVQTLDTQSISVACTPALHVGRHLGVCDVRGYQTLLPSEHMHVRLIGGCQLHLAWFWHDVDRTSHSYVLSQSFKSIHCERERLCDWRHFNYYLWLLLPKG